MMPHGEELTPEALDEQIDRLGQPGERPTPTTRLIQRLGHLYENEQADAESVERVRRRLMERGATPEAPVAWQLKSPKGVWSRPGAAPPPIRVARPRPPARAKTKTPFFDHSSSALLQPDDQQSFPEMPLPAQRQRWNLTARLMTLAAAVALLAAIGGLAVGLVLVRQYDAGGFTPSAPACPTRATATAEAWFPVPLPPDFARGQIVGTINHEPVSTLSDFHYPLNIPPENVSTDVSPFFMAWSPDARYLAVAVSAPYQNPVYVYLVDTTTHATTPIPIPTRADGSPWPGWFGARIFAWADTHTLLLFYGGTTLQSSSAGSTYSFNVTTRTLTLLPGIQAAEGVVRCSILFYLELTAPQNRSGITSGAALLHRYDLKAHREMGQPVLLSAIYPDDPYLVAPQWDVSPDGALLVYQQVESAGPYPMQQFFAANSDGSDARPIYSPAPTARYFTFIKISADGQFVVIGSQLIVSVSIAGGPIRMYGNDSAGEEGGYAGWLPDSSGFDVVDTMPAQGGFSEPLISRYLLNTPPGADGFVPGTVVVPAVQSLAVLP